MASDLEETFDQGLNFLPASLVDGTESSPFVAVATSAGEIETLQASRSPSLQWVQVLGLLGNPQVWQALARSRDAVPLDVVVPTASFSDLYRLVDVRNGRDVRVTVPVEPGLSKAVRLAASLGFPIRLLPGQPTGESLAELEKTADFYLHDPMVDAPVEYFHTALIHRCKPGADSIWVATEEDPAIYRRALENGTFALPRSSEILPDAHAADRFVEDRLADLLRRGAECMDCPWQGFCRGYFKWPDSTYDCAGIKRVFSMIDGQADAMLNELQTKQQ